MVKPALLTKCMVRPCVASGFAELAVSGLASMYPAFDGAFAPGHHGYQRACVLISGQASIGPFGSPVFACAGKTDPPSLLILSQTSVRTENPIQVDDLAESP